MDNTSCESLTTDHHRQILLILWRDGDHASLQSLMETSRDLRLLVSSMITRVSINSPIDQPPYPKHAASIQVLDLTHMGRRCDPDVVIESLKRRSSESWDPLTWMQSGAASMEERHSQIRLGAARMEALRVRVAANDVIAMGEWLALRQSPAPFSNVFQTAKTVLIDISKVKDAIRYRELVGVLFKVFPACSGLQIYGVDFRSWSFSTIIIPITLASPSHLEIHSTYLQMPHVLRVASADFYALHGGPAGPWSNLCKLTIPGVILDNNAVQKLVKWPSLTELQFGSLELIHPCVIPSEGCAWKVLQMDRLPSVDDVLAFTHWPAVQFKPSNHMSDPLGFHFRMMPSSSAESDRRHQKGSLKLAVERLATGNWDATHWPASFTLFCSEGTCLLAGILPCLLPIASWLGSLTLDGCQIPSAHGPVVEELLFLLGAMPGTSGLILSSCLVSEEAEGRIRLLLARGGGGSKRSMSVYNV